MPQSLDVRLEQVEQPIGALTAADDGALRFSYAADYLANPVRVPISLSLPLQEEAFGDVIARAFFRNLLPENDQLNQVIEREGLDQGDVVGVLFHLGADLSGAISCLPPGHPPTKVPGDLASDYLALSQPEIEEIVRRLGESRPLPNELRDPSPVAGIQRKVALCETPEGFAIPKSGIGAPTTHILKVPDTSFPREAFYEARCAALAREVGLDAAPSRSAWIAGFETLIATRFDRLIDTSKVSRIHQEDFAQALGLPPRLKYERDGRSPRAFDASAIATVLRATVIPAEAIFNFLRITFFNLAVGNTDNHAKNHALLYDRGAVPRLAPLYDLSPIRISREHNHLFSFLIGKADRFEALTSEDLAIFLEIFGLTGARARRFLAREIVPLVQRFAHAEPTNDKWAERHVVQAAEDSQRLLDLIGEAIGTSVVRPRSDERARA